MRCPAGLVFVLLAAPVHASAPPPLPAHEERVVEHVRTGAMRRLRSAECRKVLEDFRDGEGHLLSVRLGRFALPADEYLGRLALRDGRSRPLCREGAYLLSTPGAGRILVCPRFMDKAWRDRGGAEVYLIHEMLHTLGLGEDPPSPWQISRQVARRCAP